MLLTYNNYYFFVILCYYFWVLLFVILLAFYVLIIKRLRIAAKSADYLRYVRPSVRTYQRGSHWTDFREV
jgi:hypothetical protein